MKKSILVVALIVTTGLTSLHANVEVNQHFKESFSKDFVNAQDVTWEQVGHYLKATFTLYNQALIAYYNSEDGDLFAVSRNILSDRLPFILLTSLRKQYTKYWFSNLFEMISDGQTCYYATMESPDETVILKSIGIEDWSEYKRTKTSN